MSASLIKITHLIIGISLVVAFPITGQYMDKLYDHLQGMEAIPRLTFRAGHIYILLAGITNVMLGLYLKFHHQLIPKVLQVFGSTFFMVGGALIFASFFVELPTDEFERPMSRQGIFFFLYGVIAHGLTIFFKRE